MDTSRFPRFDPDRAIVCPECQAPDIREEEWDETHNYWINHDGIWYFTCYDCGHEWKAIAERKDK